jgi:ComF family protein
MLESWSNIVFGMECLGCGTASESLDPWLCPRCRKILKGLSKEVRHPADDVVCLFPMEGLTRRLIHLLKYRSIPGMATYLVMHSYAAAERKESVFSEFARPLYFVPVPLHRARFRERGYNQAEKIALALASLTGSQICRWLRRRTFKVSQTKLSRSGREQNVAGAFEFRFPGELPTRGTVVVVDDVYTTGATTGECVDALGKDFPLDVKVCTLLYDMPFSATMDYVADCRAFYTH